MNILFCSSFLDNATTGAGTFATLFLEWARDRGYSVDIISDQKTSDYNTINFVTHNKLFTRIPVIQSYQRSYIYFKTVSQQLKQKSYDLIFFNNVIEALHTARFVKEIPVFGFLHDENFMNDYMKNPSLKRKWYRNMMLRYEKLSSKMLDRVLTNSSYMKNLVEASYGLHPLKVRFSHFRTFDWEEERYYSKDISTEKPIRVLFVKHDYHRGGLDFLAQALKKIEKYKFILEIIGPEKSQLLLIREITKGLQIDFTPYKNRDEMLQSYRNADIFCTPSYSEALGLANLEAMQLCVPVVAQNIPIIKELSEKQDIIYWNNEKSLSELIVDVILDKESRNSKVENAWHFVTEKLSRKNVFVAFDELFSIE